MYKMAFVNYFFPQYSVEMLFSQAHVGHKVVMCCDAKTQS